MSALIEHLPPADPPKPKPRRREKDGAGKSDSSWRKHDLISGVASAQAGALHHGIRFKRGRGIIIDMHAGDGEGVEQPQLALFGGNPSRTTAELSVMLAAKLGNTDVVLCERDPVKREALIARWPDTPILADHRYAPSEITKRHAWALVLNDPNGPSKHGVEHMQEIAARVPVADFIIVVNEGSLKRIAGVRKAPYREGMSAYSWMSDYREWGRRLRRRKVAVCRCIAASSGFHYRVLVAANVLTRSVERNFEVLSCK